DCLVTEDTEAAIAARARMPSMVILPLVNHALSQRVEPAPGGAPFGVRVQVRDERLLVTIHDDASGFDPGAAGDADVQNIRDCLTTMHGDRAKLTFARSAGGTDAFLEIPYEIASASAEPAASD